MGGNNAKQTCTCMGNNIKQVGWVMTSKYDKYEKQILYKRTWMGGNDNQVAANLVPLHQVFPGSTPSLPLAASHFSTLHIPDFFIKIARLTLKNIHI